MTTRDSRSNFGPGHPGTRARPPEHLDDDALDLGADAADDPHPSLALGTHEAGGTKRTRVESPSGRVAPLARPAPARPRESSRAASTDDDPHARLGAELGSYRLVELLGKGGMGYVYRAEHVKLGREVALKLLRPDYARRRDAVARFFQEAKTVNRVRHRNIVDVTDFIELPDGTTFIIMELLTGTSLGRWVRTGIDVPRALAALVQICDGLAAAHAVGVVHRDLKPDNVIVMPTPNGEDGAVQVKLLDFGVAKLVNRDDEDVGFQTAAGSVIGTPAYMSPEQAGGMLVDARSDIYSLGAIMYELFTGQPMFRGRSFGEYVRKHLTEQPVLPHLTPGGAGIDAPLEATILRALEKDVEQRYQTIGDLRADLLAMLGGIETQLPIAPARGESAIHTRTGLMPPPPAHPTPLWMWGLGGALAVGLGVAAAIWYAGSSSSFVSATSPISAASAPTPASVSAPAPTPASASVSSSASVPAAPLPPSRPLLEPVIEIRVDSLPSAAVFAAGHATELCHTPCAFNIDTRDGGPTDKRAFVVRANGYVDASLAVDLTGAQRAFAVTLAPSADRSSPTATGAHPAPFTARAPVAQPTTPSASAPPADKPATPTKPTKIDPADTIDPFHSP